MNLLILDNYDSFVFNIVRYCEELGATTIVTRNDALGVENVEALHPDAIILSPGPCGPYEAGISLDLIARLSGSLAYVLGINASALPLVNPSFARKRQCTDALHPYFMMGPAFLKNCPTPLKPDAITL
jgi:para-aminobenzoate synthetase component 2